MWSKPKANGTMKVTFHVDSQYKNICWGMLVDESICAADYSAKSSGQHQPQEDCVDLHCRHCGIS